MLASIGLIVIALAGLCYLAIHFRWNSDLLSISDSNTPGTVAVNEETTESTVPDVPDTVKTTEEPAESTAPVIPDAVKENEGDALSGKIAATLQFS